MKKLSNFAKKFGKLEVYPEKDKTKKFKQIFNVSDISEGIKLEPNDQGVILQKNNERWHTDSSIDTYHLICLSIWIRSFTSKCKRR